MTGQDLHERYVEAMAAQGVETDHWPDVPDYDRDAWNAIAEQVVALQPGSILVRVSDEVLMQMDIGSERVVVLGTRPADDGTHDMTLGSA